MQVSSIFFGIFFFALQRRAHSDRDAHLKEFARLRCAVRHSLLSQLGILRPSTRFSSCGTPCSKNREERRKQCHRLHIVFENARHFLAFSPADSASLADDDRGHLSWGRLSRPCFHTQPSLGSAETAAKTLFAFGHFARSRFEIIKYYKLRGTSTICILLRVSRNMSSDSNGHEESLNVHQETRRSLRKRTSEEVAKEPVKRVANERVRNIQKKTLKEAGASGYSSFEESSECAQSSMRYVCYMPRSSSDTSVVDEGFDNSSRAPQSASSTFSNWWSNRGDVHRSVIE